MISVDIILFCYNQEKYIEQALRSIYAQVLPKDVVVRIIVADDASSDNTNTIIKNDVPQSPFQIIFLPENNNMGISKNYKRSFAATEADYVAILEGDDYWLPNHLAQHMAFWEQHPNCSMAMNRITFMHVSADGQEQLQPVKGSWSYPSDPYMVDIHKQITEGNQLGNLSACSFRGDFIRNLPAELFDLPIADWMLGVMMAEKAPIALLAGSSSVYRYKKSGVWAGRTKWQQHKVMLRYANIYDKFHHGKYHAEWREFKLSRWRDVRRNYMHYLPESIQHTWRCIKNTFRR